MKYSILSLMRKPIKLRPLSTEEQQALEVGLRSPSSFTLRRGQVLLASHRGQTARPIADYLRCGDQTVRHIRHAFNHPGVATLQPHAKAPRHRPHAVFDESRREQLRDLLHQSPRRFGCPTSRWTLALVAQVAYAEGLTPRPVRGEAIRQALHHWGAGWKRAKHWITSPDPAYVRKKKQRDRLIRLAQTPPDWVLGFADEVWWSRLAPPRLHSGVLANDELRLVQQAPSPDAPNPNALACYGLLVRATSPTPEQIWLRFATAQAVSGIPIQFLAWCGDQVAALGKQALLLVWDNASWHRRQAGQQWLQTHNQNAKQARQGLRVLPGRLPSRSPWLNPIEPKGVHGNRAVLEPERVLTAAELAARVYDYYGCRPEPPLTIAQQAA